ncbi:ABC transporter substrate-binding protein [Streptomyces sp. 8L]|uniref:ABC transporter substrate-binding protein n=1 Tax=Streptomyces sp. 8L TaxID=2877242 RepID=UPI001CD30E61|nr:ABC transporter substrate-binding protein [Streptomyces sp. 8L]MCA1222511.1 ABC transporter substrate-binding protein [Streptomyces sp. 8L]
MNRRSTPLSRRGFLLGSGAAAGGLLLSACGGGKSSGGSPAKSAGTGGASASGFPVTVPGKPGSTTVKSAPKRVAACGYLRDIDLAIALDAPLVVATKNEVFNGFAPWQKPKGKVELVDQTSGVPIEKIAAAAPDLILASDDYSIKTDFAKLSRLAPTLGYQDSAGSDQWDVMIRRAGKALGRSAQADKLVSDVRAKIAATAAAHPEFKGRTFTFGPVGADGSVFTISRGADASAEFFGNLGFHLPAKVTALPESSTPNRSSVSVERLDLIDADVVILTFPDAKTRTAFEAKPLFKKLGAVKRGTYLAIDMPTAISLAFPSVLSIPYGLDVMTPKLAAAVAKLG